MGLGNRAAAARRRAFVTVEITFQNGFKHRQTLNAWSLANGAWSSAPPDMRVFSKYGSPQLVRFENRGYSASGDSWQVDLAMLSRSPTPQSSGDQFEFNTWINTGAFAERGR